MQTATVFENLAWQRVRAGRAASAAVPSLPGVYAFADVDERYGLPTSLEWIYIGKAKSLSQRLGHHDPVREANPGLGEWLVNNSRNAQLWYAVLDVGDLDVVEQELIRTIRPRFNRRLYGGRK